MTRSRRKFLSGLLALPITTMAVPRPNRVALRFGDRYQTIEGFGTCINTWQADVAAAYRREDLQRFFLETLGASALRIPLWSGVCTESKDRWQDISFRDFRFDAPASDPGTDSRVTNEVAMRLNSASSGRLRIIATAWTPAAWMKVNASLGNGHPQRKNFHYESFRQAESGKEGTDHHTYLVRNRLRRDRYPHFAKLLVEWTRYFRSLGIAFHAISPTNEPRFSHWFESCIYTPEEYAELVDVIAWMFANEGEPRMPIYGPELMTWDLVGNRGFLQALVARPRALQSLGSLASHGYIDGYVADMRPDSLVAFGKLAAQFGKKAWITEGGFGDHEWPAPLHQLSASFLSALRDSGVSMLTTWQMLSRTADEHALMGLDGPTKKTYAAMQFWRFIRPGMVRIGTETDGTLDAVGFEDSAAGKTVVVLLNRSRSAVPISLDLKGRRLAAIDGAFITDESNDCSRASGWRNADLLLVPRESLVTLVLKTS
jgi:glucuronoarabinoxylan endo-1,4-beta-xylanase